MPPLSLLFPLSYTASVSFVILFSHATIVHGFSGHHRPLVRIDGRLLFRVPVTQGKSILQHTSEPGQGIYVKIASLTRLHDAGGTSDAVVGNSEIQTVDTVRVQTDADQCQPVSVAVPRKQLSSDLALDPSMTVIGSANTTRAAVIGPSNVPSYKAILVFVFTTVLIWLTEPLLSLVDTTVVGRPPKFPRISKTMNIHSIPVHTVELASLGPATLLCDTLVYLTYFLAIATTNSLAIAKAKQNYKLQTSTTSHVLGLGLTFGSIILAIIQFFGKALLTLILGSEGATVQTTSGSLDLTSTVVSSAWDYSRIRAYAAPLVVAGIMAQSVCLATLDTVMPALAVIASTVVNVIGDIWLVYFEGLGARGAAVATAAAGLFSSIILLASVRSKMKRWAHLGDKQEQLNPQSSTTIRHKTSTTHFISLPKSTDFINLAKLSGPIFIIMLAKLICYSAMTIRASNFGMLDMACHSIMLRIFYFFCTFGDSLSQAVQSYLPTFIFGKSNATNNNGQSMGTLFLKRMFALGGIFAIFNTLTSQLILQKMGSIFTTDIQILSLLRTPQYVFSVVVGLGLHPIIMLLEGTIMARGDLSFLMKSYGVIMILMLAQIFIFSKSLSGVWYSLLTFQVLRFFSFAIRIWGRKNVESVAQ